MRNEQQVKNQPEQRAEDKRPLLLGNFDQAPARSALDCHFGSSNRRTS